MDKETYESVWDAICDSPEEAERMKIRSELMIVLSEYVKNELLGERQLSGKQAGDILGLTQPRVSYLVNGKIQKFSLDTLVEIASRAGFHVKMEVERDGSTAA